jgi:ferredoxin/flavodoxin
MRGKMNAETYYFSGTGNSLTVGRDIAKKIYGKLISIPSVMDRETFTTDADIIGIVSPAYYMRIPGIVARFIGNLTNLQSKYIFVIVTVGGVAGGILERFSEAIGARGGHLAAGFIVRMPANYIHDAGALPVFLQNFMFRNWKKRADKIADHISSRKIGLQEKFNPLMTYIFSSRIDKRYLGGALSPDIDKNFWTDNKCNECGICLRVCPVRNIVMVNGKPAWQHHCEKCLACIQWCPRQAIQYRNATIKRKRYHHPDVKLSDVLKQNE